LQLGARHHNSIILRRDYGGFLRRLIAGNPIFLRPDLAFQSNARTGAIALRLTF